MRMKNCIKRSQSNVVARPAAGKSRPTATETKSKRRSSSSSKQRILIVEDDPGSREVYSALLCEAGYHVDQAAHALAAICVVVRAAPDLVIADIRMPIVDGRDLVRELKSHRDTKDIPIVAITGYDTPEMLQSAFEAGYDDYIVKPIDPQKFPARIAEILRKHNLKGSAVPQ
jgi:CheY-like chemotaxis protein